MTEKPRLAPVSIAVLRENPTAIERFYNGVSQDFDAFAASHRVVYGTPISYSVENDEQACVETTDKVAGGCGSRPAAPARTRLVSK